MELGDSLHLLVVSPAWEGLVVAPVAAAAAVVGYLLSEDPASEDPASAVGDQAVEDLVLAVVAD